MNATLEGQRRLINLWVLRSSIGLSIGSILVGIALFLAKGGDYLPRTPSGSIGSILVYVWQEAVGLHASAFLDFGVLVMLLTPLARLAAGVVANTRSRDWLYVVIGLVVFTLVSFGLFAAQATH